MSFHQAAGMVQAFRSWSASSKVERSPSSRLIPKAPLKSTDRLLRETSCLFTHRASKNFDAVSVTESRLSRSSKSASARLSAKSRWPIIQCFSPTVLSMIQSRMLRTSYSLSSKPSISRKLHRCADLRKVTSTALVRRASAVAGNELSFTRGMCA